MTCRSQSRSRQTPSSGPKRLPSCRAIDMIIERPVRNCNRRVAVFAAHKRLSGKALNRSKPCWDGPNWCGNSVSASRSSHALYSNRSTHGGAIARTESGFRTKKEHLPPHQVTAPDRTTTEPIQERKKAAETYVPAACCHPIHATKSTCLKPTELTCDELSLSRSSHQWRLRIPRFSRVLSQNPHSEGW